MRLIKNRGNIARSLVAGGAFAASLALTLGAAQADDQTYVMKMCIRDRVGEIRG